MRRYVWRVMFALWAVAFVLAVHQQKVISAAVTMAMVALYGWLNVTEPDRRPRRRPAWVTDHESWLCEHGRHDLCPGCACELCHSEDVEGVLLRGGTDG